MTTMTESIESGAFVPREASSGKPLELAMQRLLLTGRLLPAGAHLLVSHGFRSAEKKMIEAVYSFVLPRDAAVRRFEVKGEGFSVQSALKPVKEASEEYESGLAAGHLAALARQYRDGMVSLSLGNLRPEEEVSVTLEILAGVDLRDDGLRFRFPFTLAPSYHALARAAEVAPGAGEIELPSDLFGDLILPGFREAAGKLHQVSFDLALELPWDIEEIASPSHTLRIGGAKRVSLATESDLPDRDLVLDIRTAAREPRVLAGKGEDGRRHFAAIVPSTAFGVRPEAPRTIVLLLDRSGSMSGIPISQARKAAAACLSALGPEDRFGLVAFDDQCELFRAEPAAATPENLLGARRFLDRIDARGGTELAAGIRKAAGLLPDAGGDVFILTDGQVFGTEDILDTARATGARLHSLGIGSASQDRFLTLLSRETHGISRFATPRDRVDREALELFASAARPVATGLKVSGPAAGGMTIAPEPPESVFQGAPLLLFGCCEGGNGTALGVRYESDGEAKSIEIPIGAVDNACGETLRLLRGSRLITDVESRLGAGEGPGAKREARRWEEHLTRLSEEYGLAGRTMALVAVVLRAGDKPGEPPKTRVVPVGLPQDMQFQGVFLPTSMMEGRAIFHDPAKSAPAAHWQGGSLEDGDSFDDSGPYAEAMSCGLDYDVSEPDYEIETLRPDAFDSLLDLSIRMEADGGMPGKTPRDRILATLLTLLAFLSGGNDLRSGSLRMHVKKLLDYLDGALPGPLGPEEAKAADRVLRAARTGQVLEGDWPAHASGVVDGVEGAAERSWDALLAQVR